MPSTSHMRLISSLRKGLSDTCTGATVRHTSPGRILSQTIPHCDDPKELRRVAEEMNDRAQKYRRLEIAYRQNLSALIDLRQSLLQKAFAGELT